MAVYRGSSTYGVGGVRVVPPSVRVDVTRFHGSWWKRQRPSGSEVFRAEEHPLTGEGREGREGWPGERAATGPPTTLVSSYAPSFLTSFRSVCRGRLRGNVPPRSTGPSLKIGLTFNRSFVVLPGRSSWIDKSIFEKKSLVR